MKFDIRYTYFYHFFIDRNFIEAKMLESGLDPMTGQQIGPLTSEGQREIEKMTEGSSVRDLELQLFWTYIFLPSLSGLSRQIVGANE